MLLKGHLAGLLVMSLTLFGCTPSLDSKNRMGDQPGVNPDALAVVDQKELLGEWLTLFNCHGYDYWLSTRIEDGADGLLATLQGQAAPPALKLTGAARQPGAISGSYRITLDPKHGFLSFQPDDRQLPPLTGIYLPDKRWFAAQPTGHQWDGCSSVLVFPQKHRSKIEDLLVEAPSSASSFFGRTGIGRIFSSVTSGSRANKPCNKQTQAWLRRFIASLPHPLEYRTDLKPYVNAMYADAAFDAAFDTRLREMPLDEAQLYAMQIQRAQQCGLSQQEANTYRNAISQLTMPLYNHARHSRDEVLIDNQANALYRTWMTGLRASIMGEMSNPAQDAGAEIAQLDRLQAWTDVLQQKLSPARVDGLQTSYDDRRHFLYAQLVNARLDQQLANSEPNMESLNALANFSQSNQQALNYLDAAQRGRIEEAIGRKIDILAPAAILQLTERSSGLDGYHRLLQWESTYASVTRRLTASRLQSAREQVNRRLDLLARQIIADYQAEFRQTVAGQPPGINGLAAGTAFEKKVAADLQVLAERSEYKAFGLERLARRVKDIKAAEDELSRLIAGQPHLTALNRTMDTYLLPNDRLTESGKRLLAAIASRKAAVAPFEGLRGADYLNALYSGDFASVNALDDAFIRPYREGAFMASMNQMAPIMDGIARLAGMRIDTKKALEKSLDTASLIVPMFAVYLVDYQYRYKRCLDTHPKLFSVTTRSETVYRDGYGSYLYSVPHPDQVKYFKVNRRFAHVFEAVGLSNPDAPLGNLVDSMFGRQGRINVSDLTAGTRQMMQDFKCNSATIKQMETNMLRFFDQYLEKRKQVGKALFDR